jgi:hypothetical protein
MMIDRREWPDAGFPGVAVDPDTLNAVVVDEERCEAALEASGSVQDRAVVELARGHVSRAAELIVVTDAFPVLSETFVVEELRARMRDSRKVEPMSAISTKATLPRPPSTAQTAAAAHIPGLS